MTQVKNLLEIQQYLQDLIVNDEELNMFLNEKMSETYPDLDPTTFETDEVAELKWYGLRNEFCLTILCRVMGGMNQLKDIKKPVSN